MDAPKYPSDGVIRKMPQPSIDASARSEVRQCFQLDGWGRETSFLAQFQEEIDRTPPVGMFDMRPRPPEHVANSLDERPRFRLGMFNARRQVLRMKYDVIGRRTAMLGCCPVIQACGNVPIARRAKADQKHFLAPLLQFQHKKVVGVGHDGFVAGWTHLRNETVVAVRIDVAHHPLRLQAEHKYQVVTTYEGMSIYLPEELVRLHRMAEAL